MAIGMLAPAKLENPMNQMIRGKAGRRASMKSRAKSENYPAIKTLYSYMTSARSPTKRDHQERLQAHCSASAQLANA